jgi:hypothetical protein
VLYTLLGRVIWKIFRGYVRFRFPNAPRNVTAAGIAVLALAGAWSGLSARRRSQRAGT